MCEELFPIESQNNSTNFKDKKEQNEVNSVLDWVRIKKVRDLEIIGKKQENIENSTCKMRSKNQTNTFQSITNCSPQYE